MKRSSSNNGEYVSPESTVLYVCFEGTLCTSDNTDDPASGFMEGFGTKDEFSGWM